MPFRPELAALLALVLGIAGCASPTEREAWSQDFEDLQSHMAEVYANLEWAIDERGVEVAALGAQTRERLAAARTRWQARRILQGYVRAFHDPHLRIENGDRTARGSVSDVQGLAPTLSADAALRAIGFRSRNLGFDRLRFDRLEGYRRLEFSDPNAFTWGVVALGDGRTLGVLRIAHFGEDGYPQVAARLWDGFAAGLDSTCDTSCQWDFRYEVMSALLDDLVEGARALRTHGVDALVIDVTGNGGGTNWAAVAPRIFAPALRTCPPRGLVRHPHHATPLRADLDRLDLLLAELDLTQSSRALLESARADLHTQVEQAESPCDRRPLFDAAPSGPDCTQLVLTGGCGLLDYLAPGDLADIKDIEGIQDIQGIGAFAFEALAFRYEEGVWEGPLFVAIDGGSASATEHFLALLEANDAATLVGQRTRGAGCGYIRGGVPIHLSALDVTVRMPDCVRLRANGRNEIDGFEPHVLLPWKGNALQRAREVVEAIRSRA